MKPQEAIIVMLQFRGWEFSKKKVALTEHTSRVIVIFPKRLFYFMCNNKKLANKY
jgi:hypothetical protein